MGDPALVSKVDAATVEPILSPQVAPLVVTAFGGVVTILPIVAVEATRQEGLGCLTVRAPVPVDLGWVTSSRPIMVTVEAKASFGSLLACAAAVAALVRAIEDSLSPEALVLASLVSSFGDMVAIPPLDQELVLGVLSIVLDDKSKGDNLGSVAVGAPATVATFGGSTESFNTGRLAVPVLGAASKMTGVVAVALLVLTLPFFITFVASILSFAADDMVEAIRELDPLLELRVTGMIQEQGFT